MEKQYFGIDVTDLHKYILRGTITVSDVTYEDVMPVNNISTDKFHNEIDPYIASIKDCLDNYQNENLAFYFDEPKLKVVNIQIQKLEGIYYSFCELFTTEPLTEDEKEAVRKALSGQYSDGFGEGFEQQDCEEYTEKEEYENEDGEMDIEEIKHWINCHLWQHEKFELIYVDNNILDIIYNS